MIYLTKNHIPKIPKIQGKYSQTIYLSRTINTTYKTNKKMSILIVIVIKTLALCQTT